MLRILSQIIHAFRPVPKTHLGHVVTGEHVRSLRDAYRIWQLAFLGAGGARAEMIDCVTLEQRGEMLARSRLESSIAYVADGRHTGMDAVVMGHIAQLWSAREAAEAESYLLGLAEVWRNAAAARAPRGPVQPVAAQHKGN